MVILPQKASNGDASHKQGDLNAMVNRMDV